jgi:hypothetical protein
VPVAVGPLHQSPAAAWKVVMYFRAAQLQGMEVDDVEVGAVSGCQNSAVGWPYRCCCVTALPLDQAPAIVSKE